MKRVFALFVYFSLSFFVLADDQERMELEVDDISGTHYIVPVSAEGLIFFYQSEENNDQWIFKKYDTDFNKVWDKKLAIDDKLEFLDFVYKEERDRIFLYIGRERGWLSSGGIKTHKGDLKIIQLNVRTGVFKTTASEIVKPAYITHFEILGEEHAYLAGFRFPSAFASNMTYCFLCVPVPIVSYFVAAELIFKARPYVQYINLENGSEKYLGEKLKGNSFVAGTGTNEANETVNIIYRNEESKKRVNIYSYDYGTAGKLKNKIKLTPSLRKIINNGSMSEVGDGTVFIGTYSDVENRKGGLGAGKIKRGFQRTSNGMFFSKLGGGELDFINFYDFTEFQSFEDMDDQTFSLGELLFGSSKQSNFKLLVHDVIKREDEYLMIAEAYYLHYTTYSTYNASTNSYQTHRVFNGFVFTHAIVAGFSEEGELKWDHVFEIGDVLSKELKHRVRVLPKKGEVYVLSYSYEGRIYSKIIKGDEVLEGEKSEQIATKYYKDNVKRNYNSQMHYWYDDYYLSWGYQKIKEGKGLFKKKRKVFYFNKVRF